MTSFLHDFVKKRFSRLRACILCLLGMTALVLILGLGEPPPIAATSTDDRTALAPNALAGMIVALDPGHGGYDGGARAHDSGVWEKELTLKIAQEVERTLLAHGAKVVLTRREDVALCEGDTGTLRRKRQDLQARVDIALEANAMVFLSIHLNDYRSRKESGPQVFYQYGGDDGRLLAGVLQAAMINELEPAKKRVAMAGNYFVLRSRIPSALVECGFLSNADEEKLLLSEAYHKRIGMALARGLADYASLLKNQGRALTDAMGEMDEDAP